MKNFFFVLPVVATALLLSSCAAPVIRQDLAEVQHTGADGVAANDQSVAWKRRAAFRGADVVVVRQQSSLAQVAPGANVVLYLSEGMVLAGTANSLQYWTLVCNLPTDVKAGDNVELRWANYGSSAALKPGEVAARAKMGTSGQKRPTSGKSAGRVTVLSKNDQTLRVRMDVAFEIEPTATERFVQQGRVLREFTTELRPLTAPKTLRAYPLGADQEVGLPRLGSSW